MVLMGGGGRHRLVPRLPGRAAAGYGRRFLGADGLRRSHPVEPLWSGALSWIIIGLSRSGLPFRSAKAGYVTNPGPSGYT